MRVKVGDWACSRGERDAVMGVLRSGQVSPGERVREFEGVVSRVHSGKYGVMVNSGTDALRVGLLAMREKYGWGDGDKVVVPAMTFVAGVNVVKQAGLEPELIDVNCIDYTMNSWSLENYFGEERAREGIVAVMPMHAFGKMCDDRVYELARAWGWRVLEDSCESMGVGGIRGDISCYSFYVCHVISTGVGGMAVTNDKGLMELMRSLANHGRSTDYIPGSIKAKRIENRFKFDRMGYSSRPTEFEAAIGLEQMKGLSKAIDRRRDIANKLMVGLMPIDWLTLPIWSMDHAYMMFPLVIREGSGIQKWPLCKYLEKCGIETREMLPLVSQPCYKDFGFYDGQRSYSVAEGIGDRGFYIGCHPGMTDNDVAYVIKVFHGYKRR